MSIVSQSDYALTQKTTAYHDSPTLGAYRGDWEKEKQSKPLFSGLCFLTVAFLKVKLRNRKRY